MDSDPGLNKTVYPISSTYSKMDVPEPRGGRVKELDGFRGAAVLTIVFLHYVVHHFEVVPGTLPAYAKKYLMFLWIGVDAFFVLSGFLIGGILLERKRSSNYFQTFYLRRALRILPLYLLLLVCWWLVSSTSERPGMDWLLDPKFSVWPYLLHLQNFWMAANQSVGPLFVAPTWSLAIEEQFYLLFPLLVRFVPERIFLKLLLCGIASAPILRSIFAFSGEHWRAAEIYLLPARWDSLLLGVLVAWVVRSPKTSEWLASHRTFVWATMWITGMLIMLCPILPDRTNHAVTILSASGVHLIVAAFFANTILLLNLRWFPRVSAFFSCRILSYFGRISYAIYLFHVAFLGLMFSVLLRKEPILNSWIDWGTMLTAFALTIAFSEITWRLFEHRLIEFGHRYSYNRTAAPPLVHSSIQIIR